jgi:hypothetical protein
MEPVDRNCAREASDLEKRMTEEDSEGDDCIGGASTHLDSDSPMAACMPCILHPATLLGRRKSEEFNPADLMGLQPLEQEGPSKRGKPFAGGWGLRRQRRFSLPITIGRTLLDDDNCEDIGLRDKRFELLNQMSTNRGQANFESIMNPEGPHTTLSAPGHGNAAERAAASRSSRFAEQLMHESLAGYSESLSVSFRSSQGPDLGTERSASQTGPAHRKIRRRSFGDALGSMPPELLPLVYPGNTHGRGRGGVDLETVQRAMQGIHIEENERSDYCQACFSRTSSQNTQESEQQPSSGSSDEVAKAQLAELYCQAVQHGMAVPPAQMSEGDIVVVPLDNVQWH